MEAARNTVEKVEQKPNALVSALKGYIKIIDGIHKLNGWVLATMLAIMSVLIFWQVFARFVIGNSLTFSEEASRFLMIWLTLLGSAYALRKGTLIAVDILQERLNGLPAKIMKTIMIVIACGFYVVLIVYGWDMSNRVAVQIAPTTGITMFWPMLALPVGGLLMLLNSIAVLIEEYIGKEEN